MCVWCILLMICIQFICRQLSSVFWHLLQFKLKLYNLLKQTYMKATTDIHSCILHMQFLVTNFMMVLHIWRFSGWLRLLAAVPGFARRRRRSLPCPRSFVHFYATSSPKHIRPDFELDQPFYVAFLPKFSRLAFEDCSISSDKQCS